MVFFFEKVIIFFVLNIRPWFGMIKTIFIEGASSNESADKRTERHDHRRRQRDPRRLRRRQGIAHGHVVDGAVIDSGVDGVV